MSLDQISTNVNSAPPLPSALDDNAWLPTEPIDRTVLAALAEAQEDDERDLIVEMIDLYLNDAPHWVDTIRRAAEASDAAAMKYAAHTLKGSSASIGVSQVAEICKVFEQLSSADWTERGE